MPGLGMATDLSSLIASASPQQAAAHFASLYFGLPRAAFFPSPPHLSNSAPPGTNIGAAETSRTPPPTGYHPQLSNSAALTSQALYATRLQLSGLYSGLRFHPYFQPRLVHPSPTAKNLLDSPTVSCDTMSPNV